MAVKGTSPYGDESAHWNVVEYKFKDNDKVYVRGADESDLNSNRIDYITVRVLHPDMDRDFFVHLWGPYLSADVISDQIAHYLDDEDYTERF